MSSEATGAPIDPVDVQLRNGQRATLRVIREQDEDKLEEAIRGLSVESSYNRFFSPLPKLTAKLLERATHPEPGRELQLVAVVGEGTQEKIVGGARYGAVAGGQDCEFAVAIVDKWQGLGLARQLLEMLVPLARASGFQRMEGYILATNVRMLSLAKRLGFTEMANSEGPTIRMVRRDLRTARDAEPNTVTHGRGVRPRAGSACRHAAGSRASHR